VLRDLRRYDEALRCYDRAVQIKPNYAEAHYNRGLTLYELERFDDAVASYDKALELLPDYAAAYNNRGVALRKLERLEEAVLSHERAIVLKPDYAAAYNNRGVALHELNRFDEALACFTRAVELRPDYAEAYCNRGHTYRALNLHDVALESYQRALLIRPDAVEDHYARGGILHELKRFDEALECYEQALETDPDQKWLAGVLLHAKLRLCDWEKLESRMADLAQRIGQGKPASPPFVLVTATDAPALQRRAAEVWVRETCPFKSSLPAIACYPRRAKIRLGYYSADYYNHATAILAAGLFERHDREKFEVIAFNFGPESHDAMVDRLTAAFDRFVQVRAQTDTEIARLSRELGIDIAVDLKGFTLHQRAGIFAHRAAPIQVNYLGYPGTLGAPFMDYLVADPTLIPPESRAHYSEKIVYLPGSYQVNDRQRPIADRAWSRADFGLPAQAFVFCCFNNVYKVTPATFDCWMRILRRVEHSVLWLLEENDAASRRLRQAATAAGVDPARLIFSGRLLSPEHLARHRLAGLFLDTFPCNAHTTASDALWAGLPLLTCAGESFPSRVAASLLNAVGLPELITRSLAQYAELAVELATHPERLAALTERLSRNRLTAPLFDTELFTRRLEDAYLQMYERYQADGPPEHIFVEAGQTLRS
jgi:predicted O-linked N-acetylglucosamine transferase (SPINDLY family)